VEGIVDKAIAVGDFAMLVKSCCDKTRFLGKSVFVVTEIEPLKNPAVCNNCRHYHPPRELIAYWDSQYGWPIAWLKRIDPLQDHESVQTHDEVSA
jgi:hypothetical protein